MAAEAHSVLFYTRAGCHLCQEAREMLHRLGHRYPMTVSEVDITSDASLFRRYQDTVPVVVVDGSLTLGGRIDEGEFREWLKRPREVLY